MAKKLNEVKEMKNLALTAMVAAALFGSINVVAEASTTTKLPDPGLRDQLVSLGVPASGAENLVVYFSKIKLSSNDQQVVRDLIDDAYDLIGDQRDLTALSEDDKDELVSLANKAAKILGLNVNYTKLNGGNSITITTTNGETLVSLDSKSLHNTLKNFAGDMINGLVKGVFGLTETTGSTSVKPEPGNELSDTGATLPTTMMAGAGLVAVAAGLMAVSQRKMTE